MVSGIAYVRHPFKIFKEVNRILKPGGVFIVVFTSAYEPDKAVNIWEWTPEEQRYELVRIYFERDTGFTKVQNEKNNGEGKPLWFVWGYKSQLCKDQQITPRNDCIAKQGSGVIRPTTPAAP